MSLVGKSVTLRPVQVEDFQKIVEWTNYPEIQSYCEGDYPTSLEECDDWHRRSRSNRYQERFAISFKNNIIGDIELDQITWRSGDAELRIRIGEQALWDRGLGTDAITCLLVHAFMHMNLNRIYLKVYVDNLRAIRCYQKVGFRKEGRLRRNNPEVAFREIILMRVLKREFLRRQNILESVG